MFGAESLASPHPEVRKGDPETLSEDTALETLSPLSITPSSEQAPWTLQPDLENSEGMCQIGDARPPASLLPTMPC